MTRPAFDDFASPAQIGEIHHAGFIKYDTTNWDWIDEQVRVQTGKWPHDLTHAEAAQLLEAWTMQVQ